MVRVLEGTQPPPGSLPAPSLSTSSALAIVGGLSWALLPLWDARSTIGLWKLLAFAVPPLLIATALLGVHRFFRFRGTYGRGGRAGFLLSFSGLLLVAAGNAVEVITVALRGKENEAAHLVFFLGFVLVSLPGAVLLGLALRRVEPSGGLVRSSGLLLIVTLTLSILFGFVGSALADRVRDHERARRLHLLGRLDSRGDDDRSPAGRRRADARSWHRRHRCVRCLAAALSARALRR
jgi:hypothetical protein